MHKKAQVVTTDFILSVGVFILLILGVIIFWNNYSTRFNMNVENRELELLAIKITDLLVESPGIPSGWNETYTVEVIGLVNTDRTLDQNKLNAFRNLTYATIKEKFNIEAYDFYFKIVDLNGATLMINGQFMEIGSFPGLDEDSIVKIRRFVVFGSQKVILELSMWK